MKKKIKLVLLFIMAICLTGCNATYNIVIDDKNISEKLNIDSENLTTEQIKIFTTNPIPVDINNSCFLDYDSIDFTKEEKQEEINYFDVVSNNKNELTATATMTIHEYNNSRIANSLFNNLNVNNYDDMISIYGYNGLQAFLAYPELDSVTVNMKIKNMKVITHDADTVSNDTYSWNFNKNTSDEKTLYIEISKEQDLESEGKKLYSGYIIIGIFLACILLLAMIKIHDMGKKR